MVWVIRSSILILPSMYQSTIFGTSRAAARAAEGSARPHAAGDELEWPRRDLLACAGDTDDDALAPAAVAAFQRLRASPDVADAFEREVGAAAGQIDDRLHDLVVADVVGIDEMRHAEFLSHGALGRIGIDADDLVGAGHARALDDVEADTAEAEHRDDSRRASTLAVLMTAPMPVVTPQPM